jgi:hypothetical protein
MSSRVSIPVIAPPSNKFKNIKVGTLDVRVIPKGHRVFKGFSGRYTNNVLGNEKHFYVAPTMNTAKEYMRGSKKGFVRTYQFTREVRLLHMTHRTVNYLLRHVFRGENRRYLLFTFGQLPAQIKKQMYRKFNYNNLELNHNNNNSNNNIFKGVEFVGRRTSVHQVNKKVSERLCSFLKSKHLDGYYYTANGSFRDEIMLCDASARLLMNNSHGYATFVRNYARVPKISFRTLKGLLRTTGVFPTNNYVRTLAARKIQSAFRAAERRRVKMSSKTKAPCHVQACLQLR